jgi:hypothetical protein
MPVQAADLVGRDHGIIQQTKIGEDEGEPGQRRGEIRAGCAGAVTHPKSSASHCLFGRNPGVVEMTKGGQPAGESVERPHSLPGARGRGLGGVLPASLYRFLGCGHAPGLGGLRQDRGDAVKPGDRVEFHSV